MKDNINDREEIEMSFLYKLNLYIFRDLLPPITSVKGLLVYCFFIYLVILVIKFLSAKYDKLEPINNAEEERVRVSKSLEESRKKKTEEAMKLLQGLKYN